MPQMPCAPTTAKESDEFIASNGLWMPNCFDSKSIRYGGATATFIGRTQHADETLTPQRLRSILTIYRGAFRPSEPLLISFLNEMRSALCGIDAAMTMVKTQLTHSRDILVLDDAFFKLDDEEQRKAASEKDAMITNRPRTAMLVTCADCTPVAFFDAKRGVSALAHSGRAGTAKSLPAHVARTMTESYGCKSTDIVVSIGPTISHKRYDFLPETELEFRRHGFSAEDINTFIVGRTNGTFGLDLPMAIEVQLENVGIPKCNIHRSAYITGAPTGLFCSAAAAPGATALERVENSGWNVYMMAMC